MCAELIDSDNKLDELFSMVELDDTEDEELSGLPRMSHKLGRTWQSTQREAMGKGRQREALARGRT